MNEYIDVVFTKSAKSAVIEVRELPTGDFLTAVAGPIMYAENRDDS